MAWADLPAAAGTDWAAVGFINQFVEAINERRLATRQAASLQPYQVGDDVQEWRVANRLQGFAISVAIKFIHPDSFGSLPADPLPSSSRFRTYEQVFEDAGLAGQSDFTRRQPYEISGSDEITLDAFGATAVAGDVARWSGDGATHATLGGTPASVTYIPGVLYAYDGADWLPAPGELEPSVATAYGPVRNGDYLGPWIWNELQAVLQTCRWHSPNVRSYAEEHARGDSEDDPGSPHSTQSAARAAAAAQYQPDTPFYFVTIGAHAREAKRRLPPFFNDTFTANLYRRRHEIGSESFIDESLVPTRDFFAYCQSLRSELASSGSFDGHGDAWITGQNEWARVTHASTTTAGQHRFWLPDSSAMPSTWHPWTPDSNDDAENFTRGWGTSTSLMRLLEDFDGAFLYPSTGMVGSAP